MKVIDKEKDTKACMQELLPLMSKHGYATFSRAANKLIKDRREAEALRVTIKEKERELAELKAKNPDVFEEDKPKKKHDGKGIESLATP